MTAGQGAPNGPCFSVPLLADVDPSFKIEINVDKIPGVRLKSPFAESVDATEQCLDLYFRNEFVYSSRYMLPLKSDHVESGMTFRDPTSGFTVGDLLRLLRVVTTETSCCVGRKGGGGNPSYPRE